jgi:hypothetical protein
VLDISAGGVLLRVVVDLYTRWLSDSSYWEQAQIVYRQNRGDLVGKAGEAVGDLFEQLSKFGTKPLEASGCTSWGIASAERHEP